MLAALHVAVKGKQCNLIDPPVEVWNDCQTLGRIAQEEHEANSISGREVLHRTKVDDAIERLSQTLDVHAAFDLLEHCRERCT